MRFVFMGNTNVAWICLKYLLEAKKNVAGVFMPKGRLASSQSGFKSLEGLAGKYDVTLYPIDNINSKETIEIWKSLEPDLGIIVGWSQIIKKEILTVPRMGCIGFHAASLPWGRGGAPVNWSIITGENEIGTTLFHIDEGVDSGDILAQKKFPLKMKDTCKTVFDKLAWANVNLLMDTLPSIESGNWSRKRQLWEEVTYRPTRKAEDGLINWGRKPVELYNWVRALTHPYPGAFTFLERKKIFIWEINASFEKTGEGREGEILGIHKDDGLQICCGEGTVSVRRIQFEGEPEMWAEDFFHNYGLKSGIILGKPENFPPYIHVELLDGSGSDYRYETNLKIGETGKTYLRLTSYERENPLFRVHVNFDEKTIFDKEIKMNFGEKKNIEIKYTGTHSGIFNLDTDIYRNGKLFKKMQLLILVHE